MQKTKREAVGETGVRDPKFWCGRDQCEMMISHQSGDVYTHMHKIHIM